MYLVAIIMTNLFWLFVMYHAGRTIKIQREAIEAQIWQLGRAAAAMRQLADAGVISSEAYLESIDQLAHELEDMTEDYNLPWTV